MIIFREKQYSEDVSYKVMLKDKGLYWGPIVYITSKENAIPYKLGIWYEESSRKRIPDSCGGSGWYYTFINLEDARDWMKWLEKGYEDKKRRGRLVYSGTFVILECKTQGSIEMMYGKNQGITNRNPKPCLASKKIYYTKEII